MPDSQSQGKSYLAVFGNWVHAAEFVEVLYQQGLVSMARDPGEALLTLQNGSMPSALVLDGEFFCKPEWNQQLEGINALCAENNCRILVETYEDEAVQSTCPNAVLFRGGAELCRVLGINTPVK